MILGPILLLAALGCAPAVVHLPPPEWTPADASGPAVRLRYPVDARPAAERRDGGRYVSAAPIPQITHGDVNVRPAPLPSVWRHTTAALAAEGVPVRDDAPLEVRVHVLHLVGSQDVSDAQWVSTVTGGLAGNVGKLFTPAFFLAHGHLRVEIRDADGGVTVRDVERAHVERVPVARTWRWVSLWQRHVPRERMTRALTAVHRGLARDVARVVDAARAGRPVTVGRAPTAPAQHALADTWGRPDTLRLRDMETDAERVPTATKYASRRFSLVTGHETRKGEVVGRIGLPLDTLGYEIGLTDQLQGRLDLTLLGQFSSFGGGLRYRLLDLGDTHVAVQGRVGTNLVLAWQRPFATLAGLQGAGSVVVSHRATGGRGADGVGLADDVTWFVRGGGFFTEVGAHVPAFGGLPPGRITGMTVSPGLELQLTPTVLVAAQLDGTVQLQGGDPLGPFGRLLLVPQVAVGLR